MSRRWVEQKVKKRESDKREREYEMERRRRKPCPLEQLINKNENKSFTERREMDKK